MSESTKRFIIRQRFLMIQAIRQGLTVVQVARREQLALEKPSTSGSADTKTAASLWDIYQALKRQGLITRGHKRPKKDYRLYQLPTPGQEVQIDTKYLDRIPATGERKYQYTAIDDCTRLRVLRIYDDFSVQRSLQFLREVTAALPFKIRAIRTDGGAEFTYPMPTPKVHPFTQACSRLGIHHRVNRPGYPQANGKVERSHRTDNEEFYRMTPASRWMTDLPLWERRYNCQRAHQSLLGLSTLSSASAFSSGSPPLYRAHGGLSYRERESPIPARRPGAPSYPRSKDRPRRSASGRPRTCARAYRSAAG